MVTFTTLESEVVHHLNTLSAEIGPRPLGSQANHAAAEYITSVFDAAGLNVEELRFECPDWSHQQTVLEVGGERFTAAANMFSPSCDVTAAIVPVCTIAELEAAGLQGKIGLLYGELASSPLIPRNYQIYQPERDQKINVLLDSKQPAALITVNPNPDGLERIIADKDMPIPSATVPARVGLRLLDHAGESAHLRIVTQRQPGYSSHIIGTTTSARPERIVLCAHYDTKIETLGAWDNGSGTAALLTLAGVLARQSLPVSLEFVAFSDEEYTGKDDEEYMRCRGDQLGTILTAINMDGIGQRLGTNSIMIVANSEAFQATVSEITRNYPGVVWVDPWPQSNHSTFAFRGVPALAFSSVAWNGRLHSPDDTVEWMSADKLNEVVSLVGAIVSAIADKPLEWTRAE